MSQPKQPCVTLPNWLKANLGKTCLAPLTGQDAKALLAAVQIVELWTYCDHPEEIAKAFGIVVLAMQESTRYLAYHAIAHAADWSHRCQLWDQAGLEPIPVRRCLFEPAVANH